MYQFNFRNVKIDIFTHFFESILKSENNTRFNQQYQIIFTFNCLKIRTIKMNLNLLLYARIMKINKINNKCFEYRVALTQKKKKFKNVKLIICTIKHKILYYENYV